MSSHDYSSDFHFSESGSRLLSESLLSSSSSRTGHGGDDLSLAELSLQDRLPPSRRKFSLFAQPRSPSPEDEAANADQGVEEGQRGLEEDGLDQTMKPEDIEKAQRAAAKTREEKLQSDLYIMKKLNAAFDVYKEALRETKSSTDRVADQLENTNRLLDKYVDILAKSEQTTRILLDERFSGGSADEEQLKREMEEEIERRRREEQERVLAAQRERERKEREEQERADREERERFAREKQESSKLASRGSGVRGVRGTRASMRGMRGAMSTRGASSTASRTTPPNSSSIPSRRPGSSSSVRGSAASLRPGTATSMRK